VDEGHGDSASLPRWIIARLTREPRPKAPPVYRPPRRGIDVIREGLVAYVKYSRRGTRADVTFAAACGAGRLVAQGALEEAEALELVAGAAVDAGLAPEEAWAAARCGVESGCGAAAVGRACLLPPLSAGGAFSGSTIAPFPHPSHR
jgi:hypothetical protein